MPLGITDLCSRGAIRDLMPPADWRTNGKSPQRGLAPLIGDCEQSLFHEMLRMATWPASARAASAGRRFDPDGCSVNVRCRVAALRNLSNEPERTAGMSAGRQIERYVTMVAMPSVRTLKNALLWRNGKLSRPRGELRPASHVCPSLIHSFTLHSFTPSPVTRHRSSPASPT
jgi:hypothetical protein